MSLLARMFLTSLVVLGASICSTPARAFDASLYPFATLGAKATVKLLEYRGLAGEIAGSLFDRRLRNRVRAMPPPPVMFPTPLPAGDATDAAAPPVRRSVRPTIEP